MLDALLAEQKMPDEYLNQTQVPLCLLSRYFMYIQSIINSLSRFKHKDGWLQVILCNDCGRKGNAPYHWLYHKCSWCASYNTRLL